MIPGSKLSQGSMEKKMNGTGYGESNAFSPKHRNNPSSGNRCLSPHMPHQTANRSHEGESSTLTPVHLQQRNDMMEKAALANLKDMNAGFGEFTPTIDQATFVVQGINTFTPNSPPELAKQ